MSDREPRISGPIDVERQKVDLEKIVFIGDLHIPYQDRVAVSLTLNFLKWFKPDYVYIVGDLIDFYALSNFEKDPERLLNLQDELDQTRDFLEELRELVKYNTKIKYLQGNHEHRLIKYVWKRPEVFSLRSLKLEELLRLDDLAIEYYNYHTQLNHNGFIIEHGDMVRKGSSFTAAGMLDRRQISGISAHTHRLGLHYRTDETGTKVWYENGCLCDMYPEYIIGKPNWQQGFSVGYRIRDRNYLLIDQIPIIDKQILYQNNLWEAKV